MRRVQIHLDEGVDGALAAEAARQGISKAQLIRDLLVRAMPGLADDALDDDPLDDLVGTVDVDPAGVDEVVYG